MAISYVNKGRGLFDAIHDAGYIVEFEDENSIPRLINQKNGLRNDPTDEVIVQAIIDSFNQLASEKKIKRKALKAERLRRAEMVIPPEDANINLFIVIHATREEIKGTESPRQRQILTVFDNKSSRIDAIYKAQQEARAVINAYTTVAEIMSYDVVNTPEWP